MRVRPVLAGQKSLAVSLAWLRAQPSVVAPIASARTVSQLSELLPVADITLRGDEVMRLGTVSLASDTPAIASEEN